jgi:RNA polymerase sigma-70 factor (ECF subfamily)
MKSNQPTNESGELPDSGTFEEFYRGHYDAVSRYVARRLPPDAHDEVVASTFVVAWRKYNSVVNPSLPWLYRIASYEVAHERRRFSRQTESRELNDLHLTDSLPLEDVLDFSAAFSQLSQSDAELLRLVHWEELSRSDIAELLDCSVNAVNVRYHRALDRLSSTLHRLSNTSSELGAANELPKEQQ